MNKNNSLQAHKRSDKVKWIIVTILLVLLIGAITIMGIALNKQITTKTLGTTAYSVGTLGEDGEYVKDTSTIYTKNYVTVDGLQVKLADKADIQYKLYFYGENENSEKTLISSTEYLTSDYSDTIPTTAKYVKIVIEPLEDDSVSVLEISKYAKQLEVTYNR